MPVIPAFGRLRQGNCCELKPAHVEYFIFTIGGVVVSEIMVDLKRVFSHSIDRF